MKTYKTLIDNHLGSIRVQYDAQGLPFMHVEVKAWTPQLCKAYKQVWKKVLNNMAKEGHPCVFSLLPESDEKVIKFNKMFGFKEELRDNGMVLMVCDTVEDVWALIR